MLHEKTTKTIYLISGPCGVGKSTTANAITQMHKPSVMIEGDYINHMFSDGSEPQWEERLRLTWKNILALTRNYIQHDYNVVIDFVVESEFQWFCDHFLGLDVKIKYVALRADKETLIERLVKRGDTDSIERSLHLLNQLETSATNQRFMYDTSLKHPEEIAAEIMNDDKFFV